MGDGTGRLVWGKIGFLEGYQLQLTLNHRWQLRLPLAKSLDFALVRDYFFFAILAQKRL